MIKDNINIKEIPFVFRTTFGFPLDIRSVINSIETASTELPHNTRYHGLLVFCKGNNRLYVVDEVLNLKEVLDPSNLPRGVKSFPSKASANLVGLVDGDLVYIQNENRHYYVKNGDLALVQAESLITTFNTDADVQRIFTGSHKPEVIVNPTTGKLLVLSKTGYVEVTGGSKDIYTFDRYDEILDSNNVRYRAIGKLYYAKDRKKFYTFQTDISDTSLKPLTTEYNGAGGGGGGYIPPAKGPEARVSTKLSVSRAKVGQSVLLTYGFLHTTDGEQDGTLGSAKLIIERNTTKIHEMELGLMNSGDQITIPVDKYVKEVGNFIMSVVVEYEEEGETKTKTSKSALTTFDVTISLYNKSSIEAAIAGGGYKTGDSGVVSLSVTGGATELIMYVDGVQHASKQLSRTGGTQSFEIPISTITPGAHNLQFVATVGDLRSNSIYLDILRHGSDTPFVGLLFSRKDGQIIEAGQTAEIIANQYEGVSFEYIASLPTNQAISNVTIQSPSGEQQIAVPKLYQQFATRFVKKGNQPHTISLNSIRKVFNINVQESTIADIGIKDGAVLELIALGKSNEEQTKNVWKSGSAETEFTNVDFASSGWFDGVLRLINGAKAQVNFQPFKTDAKRQGITISFEAKIYNIRRFSESVISCFDEEGLKQGNFGGFKLTPNRIVVPIGATQEFVTEDGETITRDLGLDMPTAYGDYYSIALVIHPASEEKTIRLYINGVLSKADTYQSTFFVQQNPQGILFDSTHADIDLKYIRVYESALSDDDILNNYITDRPTIEEMLALRDKNDVLDDNGEVSWDKLRRNNKAVLSIAMTNGLETLWGKSTDTKTNFKFSELIFRSPYGRAYDLRVTDGVVRRQGTSTSTYPIKNLRIYLQRNDTTKVYRNVSKTRNDQWELVESRTYTMKPDGKPMSIINLKTDYADSSLCYNTGTSILLNDHLIRTHEKFLNPGMKADSKARFGIDGMPIDVFTSDTPEGYKRYCGQYQFNNDKSKSGYLFGQTKKDGTELALEFINNSNPVANFNITGDTTEQLGRKNATGFDASVEFLFPEKDWEWNGKTPETTAPETAKRQIIRLWDWVKSCVPRGVDPTNMTTEEVKRAFVSDKFKREVTQYFNITNLTLWHVLTDYHMSVDQRVKNTFYRTWGDGIWWLTYYDGDTAFCKRNDAFLAYDYNITRDTRDLQRNKYAFEGHNSMLWCLVLANLEQELRQSAKDLRERLTNQVYLRVFNDEIMNNWSERQYNKSGIYKYIKPAFHDYNGNGKMNYIFALNGNMVAVRNQLIQRRFSMLDAKYLVGEYERDSVTGYMGKQRGLAAKISITASDEYYFGWKTQNGQVTEYQHKLEGQNAVFNFTAEMEMSQNDPVRFIGASRIRKVDFGTATKYLQGAWNFNGCPLLEEILAPVTVVDGTQPTPWFMHINNIKSLKKIDLTKQSGVVGTEGAENTLFDVSTQTALEELKLSGTRVTSIAVAKGAPIRRLELPNTITKLKLVALPELTPENLLMENNDWSNIRTIIFDNCPKFDWKSLLAKCTNIERIRIIGVDIEDDGTFLDKYLNTRGVDASQYENEVPTCEFVGTCKFTKYIEEAKFLEYQKHFPSLELKQPQYTVIEMDDNIPTPQKLSNLDNKTGYKFGNKYEPSAHVLAILNARFPCLAKQEKSKKGTMNICRLRKDTFLKFNDAESQNASTDAQVDLSQGDLMIYEPEYWYKGVNDIKNGKKYFCYAYGKKPDPVDADTFTLLELRRNGNEILKQKVVTSNNIKNSLTEDTTKNSYRINVRGAKKVRVPSAGDSDSVVLCDSSGMILDSYSTTILNSTFISGMYVIMDVPESAEWCYFSMNNNEELLSSEELYAVASRSANIIDAEPDWVHHKPKLVGAFKLSTQNGKLGSGVNKSNNNANSVAVNRTVDNFLQSMVSRGMTGMTYDEYKNIVNLVFVSSGNIATTAMYGEVTGENGYAHYMGKALESGMSDIVRKNDASGEWGFWKINGISKEWMRASATTKVLGYELLFDGFETIMYNAKAKDSTNMPHSHTCICNIAREDSTVSNSQMLVKNHETWIIRTRHEKFMDIFSLTMYEYAGASATTYYCGKSKLWNNINNVGLIIKNGNRHHNVGGLYIHSDNDNRNHTTRLMFTGNIVEVTDVQQFLKIKDFF